jgi:hypothetical protein
VAERGHAVGRTQAARKFIDPSEVLELGAL